MNKWIKRVVATSFVFAQFLVIPTVSAGSLENIQQEKNAVEQEVTQLQQEVSNGLAEVSEMTVALDELNNEITEHEAVIADTEEDIEEQEVLVAERYEQSADQLIAMQKSEVNQNIIISVLESESLSDVFNKVYAVTKLTDASEARLIEAQEEQEKLDAMHEKLLVNQEELDAKQTKVVEQKESLDEKVAALKSTLATNQQELENLNTQEANILRAQAEKEAAAKRAAEKQASSVSVASSNSNNSDSSNNESKATNSSSSNNESKANNSSKPSNSSKSSSSKQESKKESTPTKKQPAPKSNAAGEWMTFQATGYSTQQAGLSTHTATGIDLRVNPRVIAVDPSVIPLGSLVEVQGLGVYVAGDTGGAINGRIIDIHYSTVSQALSWGRRSVNVRIIN